MVSRDLIYAHWKPFQDKVRGLSITKHFIERFLERSGTLQDLSNIFNTLKRDLCQYLYLVEANGGNYKVTISGARLVLTIGYSVDPPHPILVVKTMWKENGI